MYYSRILGRIIFDAYDVAMIGYVSGYFLAYLLQSYLLEEKKMERLRQDLIRRSRLVKSSSRKITPSRVTKIRKIYNFALRGGGGYDDDFVDKTNEEVLYEIADRISQVIIKLLERAQDRAKKSAVTRFVFFCVETYIRAAIKMWGVKLSYYVDSLTGQVFYTTMIFTGTAAGGFITRWFGIVTTLVAPLIISVGFISRSFVEQLAHHADYIKFREQVLKLLKDKEFLPTAIAHIKDGIEDSKVKLNWEQNQDERVKLNWEQNPDLKETATVESLGIFEEKPNFESIKSTTNSIQKRRAERMELAKKTAEKMELVKKTVKANSDIIDVDIVDQVQPIKMVPSIRIRNGE